MNSKQAWRKYQLQQNIIFNWWNHTHDYNEAEECRVLDSLESDFITYLELKLKEEESAYQENNSDTAG